MQTPIQTTDIKFSGLSTLPAEAWSNPGSLAASIGCIAREGSLWPLPPIPEAASPTATLPEGYPQFPVIEFGLQRAGYLTFSQQYSVPASLAPVSTASGGMTQVHRADASSAADASAAATAIFSAFADAARQQAEAKGYFHQPFFVRYALRLTDGSLILPSSPILMLPTIMPPCLAIDTVTAQADDADYNIVTLSSGSHPYCALRYRILSLPDPRWASRIAAIDIFVTVPILTYDADSIAQTGIVSYSQIADAQSGGALRGRAEANDPLAGVWAEANDAYAMHTVDSLGWDQLRAWAVTPNSALAQQLAAASEFHRIASIPYPFASVMSDFANVDIACATSAAIAAMPVMEEYSLSHFTLAPTFATQIGTRWHIGAGTMAFPAPLPLLASCARCVSASSADSYTVTARVWILHDGDIYQAVGQSQCAQDLAEAFPPSLFYPHPGAFLMELECEGAAYRMPLLPHPSLDGAYWMGTLDSLAAPAYNCQAPVGEYATVCPTPNILRTSLPDNPLCFPITNTIGTGTLMGVASAMRAVSSGQWGEYPLYAFSTDGVWALQATSSGFAVKQQVTSVPCSSAASICQLDDSVAFASLRGVMILSGSKCECVSGNLTQIPRRATDTPHWQEWMPTAMPQWTEIATNCRFAYDSQRQLLWAISDDTALVYHLSSEQWGEAKAYATQMTILTRPITLSDRDRVRVTAIELLPPVSGPLQWVLYGSDDLRRWSIIASGSAPAIDGILGSPYRYAALAIKTAPQPLHGLRLTLAQ
ncbi:MAG: hypothetical protein LUD17_04350 [Bacteroidales bacterium]|nr:hypothetical protein [Bacteroidales bacterium]